MKTKLGPVPTPTWVPEEQVSIPVEKEVTEDEMAGWHHPPDGHESEQTPGVGDGQGSLMCYSPWGHKEWDMTE